jgi:hypothetical protein
MSDDVEISPATERIIELGKTEWKKKRDKVDWTGWVHIGQSLDAGRSIAMHQVHTNQPKGRAYNEVFSAWLKRNDYHTMDSKLRANLLDCIINLSEIDAWRDTLAENKRLEWTHPVVVLRHWKASLKLPEATSRKIVGDTGREIALQNLTQENLALKDERDKLRDKLEGVGDFFTVSDPAWQIAKVIADELRTVTDRKFDEIVSALKEHRRKHIERRRKPG